MRKALQFGKVPLEGGFRMNDYWVWCGSVLEDPGNGFHMYAARWPKSYPMFEGYIFLSEIVRAWSPKMEGPYEFIEKVIPLPQAPEWCGHMAHNPTVLKYGDKYLLYFIGSTYQEDTPSPDKAQDSKELLQSIYGRIKIGLAIADSPSGPWRICPEPILKARPGSWDSKIVTNPAPCVHPDGRIFLYYRSNTPEGLRIGLAVAETPEGPYQRIQDQPVVDHYHIEDPFVWHDGKCFNMIAKDVIGTITGEPNSGASFTSNDGVSWRPAETYVAYSKEVTYEDDKKIMLGCLERPQLLFDENHLPTCLFAAAADGPGHFRNALNTWNIAIPIIH